MEAFILRLTAVDNLVSSSGKETEGELILLTSRVLLIEDKDTSMNVGWPSIVVIARGVRGMTM